MSCDFLAQAFTYSTITKELGMDLDIKRVIRSIPKDYGPEELAPLTTPWGEALKDVEVVYTTHPRPLFARNAWQTLDGWWDCAFALVQSGDETTLWKTAAPPQTFSRPVPGTSAS